MAETLTTSTGDVPATPQQRRRRLPLGALYAANAISSIGDVLTLLAIPWFVLQTTGSVAQTSVTAFCSLAAITLSAFFGSAAVDRLGYVRASVLSDLLSAVSVALIPLLYATVGLPFWALLALVFLAGLLTTPGGTARGALVPDLAQLARARMERVTAATDGVNRVARFIGAPLAGVLIVVIGTSNLLWLDAASFVVSALLIGLLVPTRAAAPAARETQAKGDGNTADARGDAGATGGYRARLGEGVGFIRRDPVVLSIVAAVMVTNLLDAGLSSVLMPAYIRQVFGSAVVLGSMVAAFGGAAFLGTVAFGAIGHRLPRRLTLGISFTLGGAPRFWTLALVPIAPLLVAVSAFAGFCLGPVNPLLDTVQYERIPAALRARVFGAITAGAMLGTPLGALLAGGLATWLGLPATLLVFGLVYLLATGSLLVNPALRGMEKTRAA
jgi:MFS family permease